MFKSKLKLFLPSIEKLAAQDILMKQDLLNETFLLEEEAALKMYYAPHNEYVQKDARVMIVGITPGWNQMKMAYESVILSRRMNQSFDKCLVNAKIAARFSGQMRKNLCNMLDEIGIADLFGLPSTAQLFTGNSPLLHTTSLIRYPVFFKGKNYTGHTPAIEKSPLLSYYAFSVFPEELRQLTHPALIIPLGNAVEATLKTMLKRTSTQQQHTYLFGFPHPSGANGHRKNQFQNHKEEMKNMVQQHFEKLG